MNEEPAWVTAWRQLAADSRDRRRVPPEVLPVARRPRGAAAGRPAIRPLGRPVTEPPDVTGSAEDVAAAGWRLGRAQPAEDVVLDERPDGRSYPS